MAWVELDGKYGFVNSKGKLVVEPVYFEVEDFSEGMALVTTHDSASDEYYKGFVDTEGTVVVEPVYDFADSFSEGLAYVFSYDENNCGYIDKTGKLVIKRKFPSITEGSFHHGLAWVQIKKMKYTFINTDGKRLNDASYDWVRDFDENGLARVSTNGKWGVINTDGEWVVKPVYDKIGEFCEGLACVVKGKKYGYINTKGKVVIKVKYKYPTITDVSFYRFSYGLAKVEVNGKWGYMNKKGKVVIKAKYDGAEVFAEGGYGRVSTGQGLKYINTKGKVVSKVVYDAATASGQ
jgi:hypothetical protein